MVVSNLRLHQSLRFNLNYLFVQEFDVGDLCHFTYTDGLAYKAEVLAIIDDTNIKIKVVNGPSLTLKKEFAMKPNTLAASSKFITL